MELGFELPEPDNYTLEEQLTLAKGYLLTAYNENNKGAIEYYEAKVAVLEAEIKESSNPNDKTENLEDKSKISLN